MRHYCALMDRNYLKFFLVLHESMERWCRPFRMHVLGLDEQTVQALVGIPDTEVSPMSAIETESVRQLKSQRTYQDYVWTLKPQWIHHVLESMGDVTYLDVDSCFFSSPDGLYGEIDGAGVAITPHRFSPLRERWVSHVGVFNAGFVHFGGESECLARWCKQTLECCERSSGFCNDQKYLDEWPELWGAHVVQHKGVNLAPWNQGEGQYTYSRRDGVIYVDEDPLVWYHFHQHLEPHYDLDPFVREFLYEPYAERLEAVDTRRL